MPFTPTHTLAIVPFAIWARRWFSTSALATGSMIPDLPLFLPVGVGYQTTHTFAGIIFACIPLGLIALFLFHRYVKRALLLLSPQWLRERLHTVEYAPRNWNASQLLSDIAALAIGACTHIVWDAFTHGERWGIKLFPVLNTLTQIGGKELPLYKLLQHGSSVIGLPLLALIIASWLAKQTPRRAQFTIYPAFKTLAILILAAVPLAFGILTCFASTRYGLENMAAYAARQTIGVFCILLLAFSLCLDWFLGRTTTAPPQAEPD
jgi:hypothetical protein